MQGWFQWLGFQAQPQRVVKVTLLINMVIRILYVNWILPQSDSNIGDNIGNNPDNLFTAVGNGMNYVVHVNVGVIRNAPSTNYMGVAGLFIGYTP